MKNRKNFDTTTRICENFCTEDLFFWSSPFSLDPHSHKLFVAFSCPRAPLEFTQINFSCPPKIYFCPPSHPILAPGLIRTCLGVCNVSVNFLNYCPLNLLHVRSHHAKVIIIKRLIQGCYNVARVRVELRSCDQSCRTNDAFTLPATLPTKNQTMSRKIKFFFHWASRSMLCRK